MTLGMYPEQVPAQWLVPPEVFVSDYDIKRFADVAPAMGLDLVSMAGGSIMDDFDGDGHLDIMASSWGLDDQLRYFANLGDGTFAERTAAAGLAGIVGGLQIVHADYDNNGYADVLVLRGGWWEDDGLHPNSLLHNNGNGTFADVTEQVGLLTFHPTQTAAWGDYDNDGWLDLFVGNESYGGRIHRCELFHSNGRAEDLQFAEVAEATGVAIVGYVKGAAWGDYDNDGLIDLYVSRLTGTNFLFANDGANEFGGWTFTDKSKEAGVTEPLGSFPVWFWDYDNDGWLDIFVSGYHYEASAGDVAADYLGWLPRPSVLACTATTATELLPSAARRQALTRCSIRWVAISATSTTTAGWIFTSARDRLRFARSCPTACSAMPVGTSSRTLPPPVASAICKRDTAWPLATTTTTATKISMRLWVGPIPGMCSRMFSLQTPGTAITGSRYC